MAPEQTEIYSMALKDWLETRPNTKLGQPPPAEYSGYNPDLILFDLEKLRLSSKYSTYFDETKLSLLIQKYSYHYFGEVPSLGDILNLIGVDNEDFIYNLGCKWNKLAKVAPNEINERV
jgi:hypothetical protein